ncbi:MAG: hypothetical protein K6E91_00765 [Butyrivibrio sp.]|nr:hypothetical protein [Butyrivibrio sp.]
MLAGVLTVLKIIVIIILVILAVIIVFLLLVLFVPIRYRADALVPDTDLNKGFDAGSVTASASISWLYFVMWCGIEYPRNKRLTIKIFGLQIYPRKHKESGVTDSKDETKPADNENAKEDAVEEPSGQLQHSDSEGGEKEDNAATGEEDHGADSCEANETGKETSFGDTSSEKEEGAEALTDTAGSSDADNEAEEKTDTEENAETSQQDEASQNTQTEGSTEAEVNSDSDGITDDGKESQFTEDSSLNDEDDGSFLDVIWAIIDIIDKIITVPMDVFEKIRYTISRACDRIDMIRATLENDIFKRAYALVKKKMIVILKMSLPDKCDIKLLAGTGDPVSTATITGVYGMLYPFLSRGVAFQPDFDRMAVMADVHIKGHITIFTIIYSAAICYFNKDVKKTVRRFKRIISS